MQSFLDEVNDFCNLCELSLCLRRDGVQEEDPAHTKTCTGSHTQAAQTHAHTQSHTHVDSLTHTHPVLFTQANTRQCAHTPNQAQQHTHTLTQKNTPTHSHTRARPVLHDIDLKALRTGPLERAIRRAELRHYTTKCAQSVVMWSRIIRNVRKGMQDGDWSFLLDVCERNWLFGSDRERTEGRER